MCAPFTLADLPEFFELARQEGWICDPWEFEFLLREAVDGCCAIHLNGTLAACVTAIGYGEQGWIGNLIVSRSLRGQGFGRLLMREALDVLESGGLDAIWLTASPLGAPLYESLGFRVVDAIQRRVGDSLGRDGSHGAAVEMEELCTLDASGWGSCRRSLLAEKVRLGTVFRQQDAYLVAQTAPSGHQIGPGGGNPEQALDLLQQARAIGEGHKVFLDTPAGNVRMAQILERSGFQVRGEALLMCRGDASGYDASRVWALGTMGSVG